MPHDLWARTRSINMDGAFYIVQGMSNVSPNLHLFNGDIFFSSACANQMERQSPQGGSIVAISSISALVGGEFQAHYTPTKAGVLSLMQSCAVALGYVID